MCCQYVGERCCCMTCCCQDEQVFDTSHDLVNWNIWNDSFLAIVKEWIFVEMNPAFVYSTLSKCVADPFTDHDCNHNGKDIGESASEFEHDDNNRNSHS